MQHVNAGIAYFENVADRNLLRPRFEIDVAPHGRHGGNRTELGENRRLADITGMDDVIRAAERSKSFGAKQAVRVRDDPDGPVCLGIVRFQFQDSATTSNAAGKISV